MRVFFSIRIGMVHPVYYGIGFGTDVGGALGDITKDKKETFPKGVHTEASMSRIPVQEKSLAEET